MLFRSDYVASWHTMGFGDEDVKWQSAGEISSRINVARTLGGTFSPHCAAIQPWHLVRGLARVLESRGVEIFEGSPVTAIERGRVATTAGEVRAKFVVRAIESFASQMKPTKRSVVPLYSLMVATEPLSEDVCSTWRWLWPSAGRSTSTTSS